MADNTTLNTGTGGDVIATDDIAGVKVQRIKVIHGADGTNDGDVSTANGLPVKWQSTAADIDLTTTPLAVGASYTSATFDTTVTGQYVSHFILADQGGTHYYEISHNGTTWSTSDTDAVVANVPFIEHHQVAARYHRARYVNGATIQGSFTHSVVPRFSGTTDYIYLATDGNTVTQGGSPWGVRGDYTSNGALAPTAESLCVLPAIANIAAPSFTDGRAVALSVDLDGNLRAKLDNDVSAAISRTGQSATNVTIAGATANRSGFVCHNDSTANLYLKLGVTASATSYTYKLRPDETLEFTVGLHWEGQIDGIWDAAGAGAAQLTELTHA